MLIDWFTVGAQALNFLVLVWLLKHFLYRPILNAIDAREKGIAARLADADGKTKDAQKQRNDFDAKNKAFDDQRAALLSKATADAKTEHDRLVDEAHKESDGLRAAQATALKTDEARLGKPRPCALPGLRRPGPKARSRPTSCAIRNRPGQRLWNRTDRGRPENRLERG